MQVLLEAGLPDCAAAFSAACQAVSLVSAVSTGVLVGLAPLGPAATTVAAAGTTAAAAKPAAPPAATATPAAAPAATTVASAGITAAAKTAAPPAATTAVPTSPSSTQHYATSPPQHMTTMQTQQQQQQQQQQEQQEQPQQGSGFDPFSASGPTQGSKPDVGHVAEIPHGVCCVKDGDTVASNNAAPELQLYSVRRSDEEGRGGLGTLQVQGVFEAYVISLLAHI